MAYGDYSYERSSNRGAPREDSRVKCEIIETGINLGSWHSKFTNQTQSKEINKVRWGENGREQWDFRTWYDDENGNHRPGKGIGFSDKDMLKIAKWFVDAGFVERIHELDGQQTEEF